MSRLKSRAKAFCLAAVGLSFFPTINSLSLPIQERSGTQSEDVTYILPIWEGALGSHAQSDDLAVLQDMKSRLQKDAAPYTQLGWSFSSWALSRDIHDADSDYSYDPTNLQHNLDLAAKAAMPILVHMNNGGWADCCTPNSSGGWGDALLDYIANSTEKTTVLDSNGNSLYGHNGGHNYFCLSRLNTVYRNYKKRNVQAAAAVLSQWAQSNPKLFAGVSLDSETHMAQNQADYNPMVVDEWKQWMQHTGIYGPGGEYFGLGRVPSLVSIADFNQVAGTTFTSWDTLQPPPSITPGEPFSEEWERWRVTMIVHAVSDVTLWILQSGIDRTAIYGHQTPRVDDYGFADSIDTITAANGAGGITNYGWDPAEFPVITAPMRGQGKNNWGNFELNPLSGDQQRNYDSVKSLASSGIKIICPNSWETEETKDQYAIFSSPNYGDAFGNALAEFFSDYGNNKRLSQPPPWNPGQVVVDLYDSFETAQKSGPDNHLEANGSCGNIVRKTVYSAVGGTVTWQVTIPAVQSPERLNLWTSVGIKDGAGTNGGETQFHISINGQALLGSGFHLHKNYWSWKRWVPMMLDVSDWAGQQVSITFSTTGETTYGWTMWGAPQIFQTAQDNNLALGKTVQTSSTDGPPASWGPFYLTDGDVDGNVKIGWSSVSHDTEAANEWAQIDLGEVHNVGKVVLFSRSDPVDFTGSGFPRDFKIRGSTNGNDWTDLVTEVDFPGAQAGEGQVFVFPSVSIRYISIDASKLSGVGNENGYRAQLAEIQVFE